MEVVCCIRRRKAIGVENQLRQVTNTELLLGKMANISLSSHAELRDEGIQA